MGKGGDKASRTSDMKAIWDKYRAGNDPVQQKMTTDVAASYEWVANAIERIGADPAQFDAIIKERPDWVDKADWTEGVVRQAVAAMTRDDVSFETVVAMTRSGIDIARANSYALAKKLTTGDPTLTARVFDVLSQAERDIARQEVVTLSEIRLALARKDAGQITFDDYKNISDEKWKEYSDYARSRYNYYAMNSLTWVEIESGQLAKGLRDQRPLGAAPRTGSFSACPAKRLRRATSRSTAGRPRPRRPRRPHPRRAAPQPRRSGGKPRPSRTTYSEGRSPPSRPRQHQPGNPPLRLRPRRASWGRTPRTKIARRRSTSPPSSKRSPKKRRRRPTLLAPQSSWTTWPVTPRLSPRSIRPRS
jgi:hypothetical protein